jgi:hypothetical protein
MAWPSRSTQQRRIERLGGGTEAIVRWRAVFAGGQVAAVEEQLHPNRESFIPSMPWYKLPASLYRSEGPQN